MDGRCITQIGSYLIYIMAFSVFGKWGAQIVFMQLLLFTVFKYCFKIWKSKSSPQTLAAASKTVLFIVFQGREGHLGKVSWFDLIH